MAKEYLKSEVQYNYTTLDKFLLSFTTDHHNNGSGNSSSGAKSDADADAESAAIHYYLNEMGFAMSSVDLSFNIISALEAAGRIEDCLNVTADTLQLPHPRDLEGLSYAVLLLSFVNWSYSSLSMDILSDLETEIISLYPVPSVMRESNWLVKEVLFVITLLP